MHDLIQNRQNDSHPEVTPEQKIRGYALSLFQLILLVVGGYVGWMSVTPYVAELAGLFFIPLDQINYDCTIPVLEKTLHFDGNLVCRSIGISIGLLAALISGGILEVILRHCKLIPKPIPRARDEIVEPLPEDFPQLELDDPFTVFADESDHKGNDFVEDIKNNPIDSLRKIKKFFIHTCLKQKGVDVQIHCNNAFFYQALRQKMPVSVKMDVEISNSQNGETILQKVESFSIPQITIESNGTVCWRLGKNGGCITMRCITEGERLSLTFRPGAVAHVAWIIIIAGVTLSILFMNVIVSLIAAIILFVILAQSANEFVFFQRIVMRHLKKIEAMYADYAKKEKR